MPERSVACLRRDEQLRRIPLLTAPVYARLGAGRSPGKGEKSFHA